MKVTRRQLRRMIREATFWDLQRDHDPAAVKAADAVAMDMRLFDNKSRIITGMVEAELHDYLEKQGYDKMSDEIFDIAEEAMLVLEKMLDLPEGSLTT